MRVPRPEHERERERGGPDASRDRRSGPQRPDRICRGGITRWRTCVRELGTIEMAFHREARGERQRGKPNATEDIRGDP